MQRRIEKRRFKMQTLMPYVFLFPFGLLFILFFIVPIGYAFYESVYRAQRSGLGLGSIQRAGQLYGRIERCELF